LQIIKNDHGISQLADATAGASSLNPKTLMAVTEESRLAEAAREMQ